MKRRIEPSTDEAGMPEELRRFRVEDWPAVDAMSSHIHWIYARARWRRANGLRVWRPGRVVDR